MNIAKRVDGVAHEGRRDAGRHEHEDAADDADGERHEQRQQPRPPALARTAPA